MKPSRWPYAAPVDVAAFVLLALSMALPSGYSYGAVLLLLLGLFHGWRWLALRPHRLAPMAIWAVVIALMGAAWMTHVTDEPGPLWAHMSRVDRPSKYLLVLLVLPGLLARRPRPAVLFWGAVAGAAGAGATALWQVFHLHIPRATGYDNAIQFGDLSLLLALWSAVWALQLPRSWQRVLAILGALLGLTASVLSDTRGGWITLPVIVPLILWLGRRAVPAKPRIWTLKIVGVVVVFCAVLVALPPVHQRIAEAVHQYKAWDHGNAASSIGLRLVLWRLGLHEVRIHPWVGIGETGFRARLDAAVAQGAIPQEAAELGHAHNELLDMLVKRGVVGLLALLLFYAVPGWLFWRALRSADEPPAAPAAHRRAAALCGLVTVVGFVGFGLTQVLFAHNSGNLMYLLPVSLWLAACGAPHADRTPPLPADRLAPPPRTDA
jgi:O-antigen ligase